VSVHFRMTSYSYLHTNHFCFRTSYRYCYWNITAMYAWQMLMTRQTLMTFFDSMSAGNVVRMVEVWHPRSSTVTHLHSTTHTHTHTHTRTSSSRNHIRRRNDRRRVEWDTNPHVSQPVIITSQPGRWISRYVYTSSHTW